MKEKRIKIIIGALFALLAWQTGCEMSDYLPGGGTGGGSLDETKTRYPVTFAPLTLDEGGEEATRAARPLPSGKLRLLVYGAYDNIKEATPLADLLYTVTDGVLALDVTDPVQKPLELPAGEYHFYALVPSDKLAPKNGTATAAIGHGDDPLASRTPVTIATQAVYVMLNPLTHKTSRVEFVVSRGERATFATLGQPTLMTLYSQTADPVAFTLGEGGGALTVPDKAETDTVRMEQFEPMAEAQTFRTERLVLPRPLSDFMVNIRTTIDKGDGTGPQDCTLRGRVYSRMFDPGRYYHFRLRVNDPAEGGDIVLLVTPWNGFGWDDNTGGEGIYITVGHWDKITYNDDIG
ncbi:BF2992 family fimbrillin-A clan protein [Parabacteroides sp.]